MQGLGMESDHHSFGDLFYACWQELDGISLVEALHRIMTLATERLRQMEIFCEKTTMAFYDTVIAVALKYVNLSNSRVTSVGC